MHTLQRNRTKIEIFLFYLLALGTNYIHLVLPTYFLKTQIVHTVLQIVALKLWMQE